MARKNKEAPPDPRAERVIDFLQCLKLTQDFHGQPFALMPWMKKIVADVYGTLDRDGFRLYQDIYIEVPKKNAKSQLLSGLALFHLTDPDSFSGQIYSCAGSRKQASIIFDTAVEMLYQEPAFVKRIERGEIVVQSSWKRIENKVTGSFYEVLSAEGFTKHGYNPTVVLFDEIHAQPNEDLYNAMMKGSGLARREPLRFVITTAGQDPDRVSIGWRVHEKAEAILKARRAGDKERDIPTWYPVIFAYNGDDIWNEENWFKANPSLGVTISLSAMRKLALEAKLAKSDELLFRWLNLNQWLTYKLAGWLPIELFDQTVGNWKRADLHKRDCWIGADLSTTTDLSAVCLIFPPQSGQEDWRVIWDAWIPADNMRERVRVDRVPYDEWAAAGWLHATEGDSIDYNIIEHRVLEYQKMYNVREFASDPSFATWLLQRLSDAGIQCSSIDQYPKILTDPMNLIETLLRSGQMTHEDNPVARWCFGNTMIAKNGNAQIKYVKEHKGGSVVRTKRIDLTAAWVIGMARAKFHEQSRSVYEDRGILSL